MSTKLDLSWAENLIDKYEYEHDCVVKISELDGVLTKLMYEKDFECDKKEFEEIIEDLIRRKY